MLAKSHTSLAWYYLPKKSNKSIYNLRMYLTGFPSLADLWTINDFAKTVIIIVIIEGLVLNSKSKWFFIVFFYLARKKISFSY